MISMMDPWIHGSAAGPAARAAAGAAAVAAASAAAVCTYYVIIGVLRLPPICTWEGTYSSRGSSTSSNSRLHLFNAKSWEPILSK